MKEFIDLRKKVEADPNLRGDSKIEERFDTLGKEGDRLLKELGAEDREKQEPLIEEIVKKYAPEILEEVEKSNRAANEVNAMATLKNVAVAEADFRMNDRDFNGYNDYWVADVSGLNRIAAAGGGSLNLIESAFALADARPCVALDQEGVFRAKGEKQDVKLVALGKPAPKAGYRFVALESYEDDNGKPTKYDDGTGRSADRYAFCAYPAEYPKSGTLTLIVGEDNNVFKKDTGGKPPQGYPRDPIKEGWARFR